jgi:hypothetical protein
MINLVNENDPLYMRIMDWMMEKVFVWMLIVIMPGLMIFIVWIVGSLARDALFPPTKFSLVVKEWQCVEYEQVRSYVSTGKVIIPTYHNVCVTYHKIGTP